MDELSIRAYLDGAGAAIAFDTSAMKGGGNRWRVEVAQCVQRINEARREPPIKLFVPVAAHAEMLHDYRQSKGDAYSAAAIVTGMQNLGLEVIDFSAAHADHFATLAARSFPSSDAWRRAKIQRCLSCVGLPANHPVSDHPCSATVDWLIAAQADAHGYLLIVDDRGDEFAGVPRRARRTALLPVLHRMLDDARST
jgi:hypothetical protein